MSDLDDELLALAGGDSDDDGSVSRGRGGSDSPRPAKKESGKLAKTKRRSRADDSEEEGEA